MLPTCIDHPFEMTSHKNSGARKVNLTIIFFQHVSKKWKRIYVDITIMYEFLLFYIKMFFSLCMTKTHFYSPNLGKSIKEIARKLINYNMVILNHINLPQYNRKYLYK